MYSTKTKNTNTKKTLAIIVGVVIFLGIVLVLEKTGVTNFYEKTSPTTSTTETINLEPPTEEEQQTANLQKEKNQATEEETVLPDSAKVAIVDASVYDSEAEVRAFVTNVVQDGTCTVTFSKGDLKFVKTVPAYADASSTPCITLTVPITEFSESGIWEVKITYSNDTITGSATTTMTVEL
jgi:hypothetical protein